MTKIIVDFLERTVYEVITIVHTMVSVGKLKIYWEGNLIYDTYWHISLEFIVCVGRQRMSEQCISKSNCTKNIAELF